MTRDTGVRKKRGRIERNQCPKSRRDKGRIFNSLSLSKSGTKQFARTWPRGGWLRGRAGTHKKKTLLLFSVNLEIGLDRGYRTRERASSSSSHSNTRHSRCNLAAVSPRRPFVWRKINLYCVPSCLERCFFHQGCERIPMVYSILLFFWRQHFFRKNDYFCKKWDFLMCQAQQDIA